jgi:glucose/arabinose dehydrogenase
MQEKRVATFQPSRGVGLWIALVCLGCNGGSTTPPSPPPPPTLQVELVPVASGFASPLDIQQAGDGSGRLFVVEQGGKIKIIQNGSVVGAPYLDISSLIVSGGEEGLLGLAFHPSYSTNGCFYVNYTTSRLNGMLQTAISEFRAATPGSNTVNTTSEHILFTVNQPEANHNGGGLAFGKDGFLYIGLGDGGKPLRPCRAVVLPDVRGGDGGSETASEHDDVADRVVRERV